MKQHMYADAMSLTENYSLWSQDRPDITAAVLQRVYAADNHLSALQVGLQEVVRLAGARHGVLVIHHHQGDDVYPLFSAGGRLVCAYAFDGPDAPLLGGATSPWSAADISDWSSMPVHILLKSFDNVVGAIHLDRVDYLGPMAEEKQVAVEMLARQLAFIVENSELSRIAKEEQTLLDMLTAAVQISQRLNVGLDAEQPLAEFLESCRFLLDAERCSILVLDREKEKLRLLAGDGLDPSDDRGLPEVGLHDSIAGWVARTGESVLISNVHSDSERNKTVDAATGFETRQLVCVPLSVRGKVLGVIQAVNKINGNFNRLDLGLLQVLALNVATAMENTKRYARKQAEVEQATELYSVASHGLRSPLMSILTSVEWILETGVQNEAHKARLEDIRSQTFSLSQFASEILDLSRVEMGNVRVKLTPVAIVPFIKRVLAAFELRVPSHRFEIQVEGTIPPARADESQLPIVLDHLLENAVKYSPAGSVIRVKVAASNEHVMISVLDEGQGIPADELKTVFSRFYRGRKQTSKGHSLGLGLYIARKLVQAQGGDIWAESEVDQGACFTFTLPWEEEIGG